MLTIRQQIRTKSQTRCLKISSDFARILAFRVIRLHMPPSVGGDGGCKTRLSHSHPDTQIADAARTDGKELITPAMNKVRRTLVDV
jgi:hypothetical protein